MTKNIEIQNNWFLMFCSINDDYNEDYKIDYIDK